MLFDVDEYSGIIETFHKEDNKIFIKKHQDTNSMLDMNAVDRNGNGSWKGELHKIASVPLVIVDQWREELKAKGYPHSDPFHKTNKTWLIARLNNSNYGKLRTKDGNI